jgi:hypothetical protein
VKYKFDWWSIGPINLKAGVFNNFDVQLILEPYNRAMERELSPWMPAGFYMGFTTQVAKLKSEGESNYHTEYRNSASFSRGLFGDLDGYVELFSAVSTEKDAQ